MLRYVSDIYIIGDIVYLQGLGNILLLRGACVSIASFSTFVGCPRYDVI